MVIGEMARLGDDVAQRTSKQQFQVAADGDVGVADVGGGLGQRQREESQLVSQCVRLLLLTERLITELCLQAGEGLVGGASLKK
jgi:hypothetical protein